MNRFAAIPVLLTVLSAWHCQPNKERLQEYKLLRYRQVERLENLFSDLVDTVKIAQSSRTSDLFKAKYRKDLNRSFDIARELYDDENNNREKLRNLLNEKAVLFAKDENAFNEDIQLGFSVENQLQKESYLFGLNGQTIKVAGRVLDVAQGVDKTEITLRVPFFENVLKTNRIVMMYIEASTDKMSMVRDLRRYHDAVLELKIRGSNHREMDHFSVVEVKGSLVSLSVRGWLGMSSWKSEPAFLPQAVNMPKADDKDKGKKSNGKKSSSGTVTQKKTTGGNTTSKTTGTTTTTPKVEKKNLEDDYQEDDEF